MKKMSLSLRGGERFSPVVKVNGKALRMKKNGFGSFNADIETEEEFVLEIYTWNSLNSPLWFLWEILYFIVSLLGIFDWFRDREYLMVNYRARITANDGANVVLKYLPAEDGQKAIACEGDCAVSEEQNVYLQDNKCRTRSRVVKAAKCVAWIAIIAAVIAIIIKNV